MSGMAEDIVREIGVVVITTCRDTDGPDRSRGFRVRESGVPTGSHGKFVVFEFSMSADYDY
jgi:hypothetical protein